MVVERDCDLGKVAMKKVSGFSLKPKSELKKRRLVLIKRVAAKMKLDRKLFESGIDPKEIDEMVDRFGM